MKNIIIKRILLLLLILFPKILSAQELPIIINQVLVGQNEGAKNEFVELYNPNDQVVNLEGYSLKKKTASGSESNLVSSKKFLGTIPAKGFFLISSPEFQEIKADLIYSSTASLSANNSLLLYNQNKEVIDKIGWGNASDFYQKALENPNNNEVIKRIKFNYSQPNNANDFIISPDSIEILNSRNEIISIENYFDDTLHRSRDTESDLREHNLDEKQVEVEGLVINLPGEFGSQYFYIIEENEKQENYFQAIQIYNYHKNFPNLKVGDKIKVKGELVENDSGSKIKTKEVEDIIILSSNNPWPELKKIPISSLNDLPSDSLIKIKGEITQNRASRIYIDDGGGEILIEIKKGSKINKKILEEAKFYSIEALFIKNKGEIKILPFSEQSIKNLDEVEEEKNGEMIKDNPLILKSEKRNKEKIIMKYFLTTIVGLTLYFSLEKKIKKFLK